MQMLNKELNSKASKRLRLKHTQPQIPSRKTNKKKSTFEINTAIDLERLRIFPLGHNEGNV